MNHGAYRILQTFLQEAGPLSAELPGYVPEQAGAVRNESARNQGRQPADRQAGVK